MSKTAIEIEVDGPHNERLFFAPLSRAIRGRFDLMRLSEPMARIKAQEWPVPIPSQRLGITSDGQGYIVEPLHEAEFAALREKIERQGMTLEPARTEIAAIDLPTWLYWLKRAVESGLAKIVSGKLPDKIDGTPQTNFIVQTEIGPTQRLAVSIEKQNELFERLLTRLTDNKP